MHTTFQASSLLFLTSWLITSTNAASCTDSGYFCAFGGATRDEMYAARQEVCGGPLNRWKTSGLYTIPSKGAYLRWSGVGTQQTCWNAFQNIIDQCHLGDGGVHTHAGQYEYDGVYYNAVDCE
jgi:hypothetical protein